MVPCRQSIPTVPVQSSLVENAWGMSQKRTEYRFKAQEWLKRTCPRVTREGINV